MIVVRDKQNICYNSELPTNTVKYTVLDCKCILDNGSIKYLKLIIQEVQELVHREVKNDSNDKLRNSRYFIRFYPMRINSTNLMHLRELPQII